MSASLIAAEVAPLAEPHDWQRLGIDPMRPVSHLSLGNPHSVVATDDVVLLDAGCLCCANTGALHETLADLAGRRAGVHRQHDRKCRRSPGSGHADPDGGCGADPRSGRQGAWRWHCQAGRVLHFVEQTIMG